MGALWQKILDFFNPNVFFEADYRGVFAAIRELLADPLANRRASLLSLSFGTVVLLIILTMVIIVILRHSEHETVIVKVARPKELVPAEKEVFEQKVEEAVEEDTGRPWRKRLITAGIGLVVFTSLWAMVGYSSSLSSTCLGCHKNAPHDRTVHNPHRAVNCARCHDSSSQFQVLFSSVPKRFAHFYHGMRNDKSDTYGSIINARCLSCHKTALQDSITNKVTGVRVSHTEPLDKGFACLDCHRTAKGTVLATTRGMTVCNRCHNNQTAKANCRECHTRDYTYAASAYSLHNFQTRLVPNPGCTSCHNMPRDCDPCHNGVRLPHSQDFMKSGHALVAARAIWNGTIDPTCLNDCHNASRRPCTACHKTTAFPQHGSTFKEYHKLNDPKVAACTCHSETRGVSPGRNICYDVCHRPGTSDPQIP